MARLDVVRSVNTELVRNTPLVAVFVGGTAGIGELGVRGLTKTHGEHGKGLRIYIVGRNQSAAENIIADCRQVCPKGQFTFVRATDLALLKDVDRACAEITAAEEEEAKKTGDTARVDFLVMTQGLLNLSRKETAEGLDETMSLFYYSRMRFAYQLVPLLVKSSFPAHVISILAPGHERNIITEDLSLRDPKNFGLLNVTSHMAYMTTFFQEQLAARHPGKLSLSHVFPGSIKTKFGQTGSAPWWVKWLLRWVLTPLMSLFCMSHEECEQRVVFLASPKFPARSMSGAKAADEAENDEMKIAIATDDVVGGGVYRIDEHGDAYANPPSLKKLRDEGVAELIWKHTVAVFDDISAGNVFRG